jgi:hypothetical protein
MRRIVLIGLSLSLLVLAVPVWSQKASDTAKGILGYLDPKTGAFRPLRQAPVEEGEAPLVAPTTGAFVFHITITIKSANLGGNSIFCTANAATNEVSATGLGLSATETATVKATVAGTTATCTAKIPYSWPLKTPTLDSVTLDYEVLAVPSTTALALPTRLSTQSLPTIKVPLTGATTIEAIASTI